MAYGICKICKKMFEKNGIDYCDLCYEINEKEYKLVLDYIEKNPDNTVLEIISETGVSMKTINRFVEEGIMSYKDQ